MTYNTIKLFSVFIFTIMIFTSCDKSITEYHWKAQLSNTNNTSFVEIFKRKDSVNIVEALSTKNISRSELFNKSKANEIASVFKNKFKIDISEKFTDNPEGIVVLGLLYAAKEFETNKVKNRIMSLETMQYSDDARFDCFLTAVGDIIGVAQVRTLWTSIMAGATEETIIAAVSLIGRRVAGVLTVAIAIYSTGECLGWW